MSGYVGNATVDDLALRIRGAKKIVISTHVKPDGDAIGSTLALSRALTILGIENEIWYLPPVGPVFESAAGETPFRIATEKNQPPNDADLVIVSDTGARSQLRLIERWLEDRRDRVCIIDHHIQGDPELADLRVIRTDAAAASEIVASLIEVLDCPLDSEIAEALYLGIATDTGWFRFSNTSASALRLAATLRDAGVDHSRLYRLIEQNDEPGRLKLLARALESMEMLSGGRAALLTLRRSDFTESDAGFDDTHGFSDIPQSIGSVEVVCLVTEVDNATSKLSLRSKDGPQAIDVNALARRFGGGGHVRASGAKIARPIDVVRGEIAEILSNI
ncbi:MAG: bifunctional oligoribonuclease/PAP phosphatase NrnA [Phycisphaerales bacterium]